eukprot:4677691-Pyramimonas_sp.AAC.1
MINGCGIFLLRDCDWSTCATRYIPFEGLRLVDGRGLFLLTGYDWSWYVGFVSGEGGNAKGKSKWKRQSLSETTEGGLLYGAVVALKALAGADPRVGLVACHCRIDRSRPY